MCAGGRKPSDDIIGPSPKASYEAQERTAESKLVRTRARDARLPQALRRKLRIVEPDVVLDTRTIELSGRVFSRIANGEVRWNLTSDIIGDHIRGFDAPAKST